MGLRIRWSAVRIGPGAPEIQGILEFGPPRRPGTIGRNRRGRTYREAQTKHSRLGRGATPPRTPGPWNQSGHGHGGGGLDRRPVGRPPLAVPSSANPRATNASGIAPAAAAGAQKQSRRSEQSPESRPTVRIDANRSGVETFDEAVASEVAAGRRYLSGLRPATASDAASHGLDRTGTSEHANGKQVGAGKPASEIGEVYRRREQGRRFHGGVHEARAIVHQLAWSGELADTPAEVLAHLVNAAPTRAAACLSGVHLDKINTVSRPRGSST
jgi:hypothetical protein